MVGAWLLLLVSLLMRLAACKAVGGPGAVCSRCGVTTSTLVFLAATTEADDVITGTLVGVRALRLMAGRDFTAEMGSALTPLI
jgi:hypothetical protein